MNKFIQEHILRWIHGEMREDEQKIFAEALRQNPILAQAVAKARLFDRDVQQLTNSPDLQSDAYADRLLSQIDREVPLEKASAPGTGIAELLPSTQARPSFRKTARWILAAAASLAVLLGPGWLSSPLEWAPSEFITESEYRHQGSVAPSKTASPQMKQLAQDLQQRIQSTYRSSQGWTWRPHKEWSLRVTIQTIQTHRLAITVVATSAKHPGLEKDWTEYYRDMDACRSSLDLLGSRIGSDLAKEPAHEKP
ncbi:MAG TPA: hypothetical protein DCZ95_15170 [Verrucomicrobia bacterium]|nr:MAG: hypothetical protein A2X46_18925 [Lentisphaerae bacterium GWF2_57_35]HBA85426.1 hypothetical protein [Verrucomicrobiota bacterium]